MRRHTLCSALLFVGVALLAACGESNPAGNRAPRELSQAPRHGATRITAGECTTPTTLLALADSVFGAGSPDANSAKGKVLNLVHQYEIGADSAMIAQAYNIVSFTLKKNSQNPLPGQQYIVTFVNDVFCYAGLNTSITDPTSSWLIYPTDLPQIHAHSARRTPPTAVVDCARSPGRTSRKRASSVRGTARAR